MAYFGTTPDKKSHDHDVGEKAKNHGFRLSGAFWRVNGKLGLREIADPRARASARFIETSDREELREATCSDTPASER